MKAIEAKRAFDNALEYLYERGELNFPKVFKTNKKFQVTKYKEGTLSFKVNGQNYISFLSWDTTYEVHLKGKEVNMDYAILVFIRMICREMFNRI